MATQHPHMAIGTPDPHLGYIHLARAVRQHASAMDVKLVMLVEEGFILKPHAKGVLELPTPAVTELEVPKPLFDGAVK